MQQLVLSCLCTLGAYLRISYIAIGCFFIPWCVYGYYRHELIFADGDILHDMVAVC